MHICDSGDLCRYFDIYPMYSVAFVVWWIITQWHLPLVEYGVGVNIATDNLCESDGCYCKLPLRH